MSVLEHLKAYLTAQGFESVWLDCLPDAAHQTAAVGLFCWNAPRAEVSGETSWYVQIQVRRETYDSAREDCQTLLEKLDSGRDERLIVLDGETSCIGKIRRGPLLLERGVGTVTFYGEMVFWTNEG